GPAGPTASSGSVPRSTSSATHSRRGSSSSTRSSTSKPTSATYEPHSRGDSRPPRCRRPSRRQDAIDDCVGEVAVVACAGDLVDGRPGAPVVGADSRLVQPASPERLVGAVEPPFGLDGDPAAALEGEHACAFDACNSLAVRAVSRRSAVGADPAQVVLQADDRHRLAPVRPGPATVAEDASPGGQLPVPDTQEPVRQLDLQPHPQRTAAVVADPPGVIALAHPTVDTSRD